MRQLTEVETMLTSVERVDELRHIEDVRWRKLLVGLLLVLGVA
jgi:hypothetical protein